MIQRCTNPKNPEWKDYGGRGITVCERWLKFKEFYEDIGKLRKDGLELDRKDVNGNYEPNNCQWTTKATNLKNRRNRAKIQSKIDHVSYNKSFNRWQYIRRFTTQEEAEQFAQRIKE